MNSIKLHDIKALENIPDYSFFVLLGLILITLFILISIIYYAYQYFKNRNSIQKEAYKLLQNLEFTDSKKCAYIITQKASLLVSNEREKKLYEELIEDLEQYKYKKEVEQFSMQTQQLFKLFMDAVDVK